MTIHAEAELSPTSLLAARIVAAYVSHNSVSPLALPGLIGEIGGVLNGLRSPATPPPTERPKPAISVQKSITPDAIVCLEDGKPFKSLKRHIAVHHGMTPGEYRSKWDLPADYPMVAPNYSSTRSQLARSGGLGRKPEATAPAPKGKRSRNASAAAERRK